MAQPVAINPGRPAVNRSDRDLSDTGEVLAEWSGEGITIGEVTAALDSMRRRSGRAATRTSVLSLVVVSALNDLAPPYDLSGLCRAVHPGRTVLLWCEPGSRLRLDARASLRHRVVEGREMWWEEVAVSVHGRACSHLDSLVGPLTLSELPVAVWYPGRVPSPRDRLIGAADVVIIDTAVSLSAGADLAGVVGLFARHRVVDMTWIRLRPWRELLAGLFEPYRTRDFLGGIDLARVEGPVPERHLLAGWLADRLGLAPARVQVAESEVISALLTSRVRGRVARFRVEGDADTGRVTATAEVEGSEAVETALTLPDNPAAASLRQALIRLERDPIYERSVTAGLGLSA